MARPGFLDVSARLSAAGPRMTKEAGRHEVPAYAGYYVGALRQGTVGVTSPTKKLGGRRTKRDNEGDSRGQQCITAAWPAPVYTSGGIRGKGWTEAEREQP